MRHSFIFFLCWERHTLVWHVSCSLRAKPFINACQLKSWRSQAFPSVASRRKRSVHRGSRGPVGYPAITPRTSRRKRPFFSRRRDTLSERQKADRGSVKTTYPAITQKVRRYQDVSQRSLCALRALCARLSFGFGKTRQLKSWRSQAQHRGVSAQCIGGSRGPVGYPAITPRTSRRKRPFFLRQRDTLLGKTKSGSRGRKNRLPRDNLLSPQFPRIFPPCPLCTLCETIFWFLKTCRIKVRRIQMPSRIALNVTIYGIIREETSSHSRQRNLFQSKWK